MMNYGIPEGFRYHPTRIELMNLLRHIITVGWLGLPWIAKKTLYGPNAEPWVVFSDFDDSSPFWVRKKESKGSTKLKAYVLTKLTRITPRRFSRTAGSGTWNGQGATDIKNDSGTVIGRTTPFKYTSKNGDPTQSTWSMREYSLNDIENPNNYVICQITKTFKTRPTQPPMQLNPLTFGRTVTQQLVPQLPHRVADPATVTQQQVPQLPHRGVDPTVTQQQVPQLSHRGVDPTVTLQQAPSPVADWTGTPASIPGIAWPPDNILTTPPPNEALDQFLMCNAMELDDPFNIDQLLL